MKKKKIYVAGGQMISVPGIIGGIIVIKEAAGIILKIKQHVKLRIVLSAVIGLLKAEIIGAGVKNLVLVGTIFQNLIV